MREIKFEYGFQSVNGIVKKVYKLSEIPNIKTKCDVWDILPIVYVRQYTGLKDKNGKEIYEGDFIIITESDRITYYGQGFITFKEGAFFINDMLLNDISSESLVSLVTGNIHQN